MLAIIYSRACIGIHAPLVSVETHLSNGLPYFSIVGLPEATVKESKDRVRSALLNSHFEFPTRRITINLAPADLPKEGGRFDLPIALGILAASGQIPIEKLSHYEFAGELALSGMLRGIKGVLPLALACVHAQRKLILPYENLDEVNLIKDLKLYPAHHLLDVCRHLSGLHELPLCSIKPDAYLNNSFPDICEIKGQPYAKHALEIAAAGGHSLLLYGSPGTGKSMLAHRLSSLLPCLTDEEATEVAAIHSISNYTFDKKNWKKRPFRAPHHSASNIALVGGGSHPKPGEISLAHHGVLFLDELPEYNRKALEALREPLETGMVTISRAARQAEFPARFQLIAAMNPCPCGYWSDPSGRCNCTSEQIQRYRQRISGPLLDRIDMQLKMIRVSEDILMDTNIESYETSAMVRQRVAVAREKQFARADKINAYLQGKELESACQLGSAEQGLLKKAIKKFNLSARSFHRILRVARTIADLAASQNIEGEHLFETLNYRNLDRESKL